MVDVVSASKRSEMMAGIRGKNTTPELLIRRSLHALGLRYRLHDRHLPGRPDLVFPSRKSIIEVQGCFWHGHDCALFKWPRTRSDFWRAKIEGNRKRDDRNHQALVSSGWRILLVWECSLKGAGRIAHPQLVARIREWLDLTGPVIQEITGTDYGTR